MPTFLGVFGFRPTFLLFCYSSEFNVFARGVPTEKTCVWKAPCWLCVWGICWLVILVLVRENKTGIPHQQASETFDPSVSPLLRVCVATTCCLFQFPQKFPPIASLRRSSMCGWQQGTVKNQSPERARHSGRGLEHMQRNQ